MICRASVAMVFWQAEAARVTSSLWLEGHRKRSPADIGPAPLLPALPLVHFRLIVQAVVRGRTFYFPCQPKSNGSSQCTGLGSFSSPATTNTPMAKRQFREADGQNRAHKRLRVVHEAPTHEDIQNVRHLRQLLAFDQDVKRARHGETFFTWRRCGGIC